MKKGSRQGHNSRELTRKTKVALENRPRQVILSLLVISNKENPAINRKKIPSRIVAIPKEEIGHVRRRAFKIRIGARMEEYREIILQIQLKVIKISFKRTKKSTKRVRAKVSQVYRRKS